MRRQVTAVSAGTPRRNWMKRFGSPRLQSAESQMTRPFDMTWSGRMPLAWLLWLALLAALGAFPPPPEKAQASRARRAGPPHRVITRRRQ